MASLTLFGGICTLFLIGAALIYARLIPSRYTGLSRPLPSAKQQTSAPAVSVTIVVLGDIGHSPRMQYHAQSIAKHGGRVNIVGYLGESLTLLVCKVAITHCIHSIPT